jgi:cell division protein FtsA
MVRDLKGSATLIAGLDAGVGKIACTLWLHTPGQMAQVLGRGQVPSDGFKAGDVVAPLAAATAIRAAMAEAERSAGAAPSGILVSANCGRIASVAATADLALDPAIVTLADLNRLTRAGRAYAERGERTALHMEPTAYWLDGRPWLHAPLERFGRRLEARMQLVAADTTPLRRLLDAVEHSGVPVVGVVPAALCSAVAVTTQSERQDGIAVVDLGAGTTSIAVYAAGGLVGLHTLALGGQHLTHDVAEAHQVTWLEAERIKTTYANEDLAHAESARDPGHMPNGGPHSR